MISCKQWSNELKFNKYVQKGSVQQRNRMHTVKLFKFHRVEHLVIFFVYECYSLNFVPSIIESVETRKIAVFV